MEPSEIKAGFRGSLLRQVGLAVVLLPLFVYADATEGQGAISMGAMLGLALSALGFSLWNWRCPSCSGYFGREMYPRHCGACGVELR